MVELTYYQWLAKRNNAHYTEWDRRHTVPTLTPEAINKLSEQNRQHATAVFDRLYEQRLNKAAHVLINVSVVVKWKV